MPRLHRGSADTRLAVALGLALLICAFLAGCSVSGPSGVGFPDVTAFDGCLDGQDARPTGGGRRMLACVTYDYDGSSVLLLTHSNTTFNCAPVAVGGHVSVVPGRSIRIVEAEDVPVPADCLCLFNVDYEITPVPPGHYNVTISELYARAGNEQFDFELDLTEAASGETCLVRAGYPWE
ncbi:hypothetical protein KAW64_05045 [bacterium]|nr:hypothetical protein [bacterium]